MAQTIVLTNQKGGVGKTTTSAALAAGLAKKEKRVLAIDLDPQGNLGFSFGLDIENGNTLFEALKGDVPAGIQRADLKRLQRGGLSDHPDVRGDLESGRLNTAQRNL